MVTEHEIVSTLYKLGRDPKEFREYFLVNCLFPDHADNNPSMILSRNGRGYKCWGCGRSGSIRSLFEELGFDLGAPTTEVVTKEQWQMVADKFKRQEKVPKFSLPSNLPFHKPFRKYSTDFLHSSGIDARYWVDEWGEERIIIPFKYEKILIGYTARALRNKDDQGNDIFPKYWTVEYLPTPEYLYPYDLVIPNQVIVLVEGAIDAWRLLMRGIFSLALLGTETWGLAKRNMLLKKMPLAVILLLDNDPAGQKTANKIYNDLKPYVNVGAVPLPDGSKDPDDVDDNWLNYFYNEHYLNLWRSFQVV